jgi:DNA repair protein RecN (Recombination protein N)
MIRSISIQNYAIIDHLEIQFSDKLTIITGETGAGKSIMLGALGLIMGNRADTKVLFEQDKKCVIEATFDISAYDLQAFFQEHDLDYTPETVIRREITNTGKTRAFVNDTPVNLPILKELTNFLIDLHQQFDTLDIQKPEFQLQVVDALAGSKNSYQQYRQQYRQYERHKKQLQDYIQRSKQADKETDFLRFQLEELREANLQNGEQENLEQEQNQLTNAEDIKRILGQAAMALVEDEQSLDSQLSSILQQLNQIANFHPKLPKLVESLESLRYELEEIGQEFSGIAEDTEYDGARLQEIEERLDQLYRLQTKHGAATEEDLLGVLQDLEQRLQGFEDLSEKIAELETLIEKEESQLWALGRQLSEQRHSMVQNFETKVQKLLAQLSMKYAVLKVSIQPSESLLPSGIDQVRFLFSANKGGRLEEIKNVASGGELSRLALCIKSLVAGAIALPTLIFDEIDAGVSGEVAAQMGLILQDLAQSHQMISITHSPQIAAKAHLHLFVHKVVSDERTKTSIRTLGSIEERIFEIAKMLSGDPPSEGAKQNAKELIGA